MSDINDSLADMLATNDQGRTDYLRRAEMARREAVKAPEGSLLREGFLKLAAEWERLAGVIPERQSGPASY